MEFSKTDKVKGTPISEKFIENIKGILNDKTHIHHSHISGEILGYSHSYCSLKVRENKKTISVIAHNLFCFDCFFFLKGIRAGSWRTRDIGIGGKKATDINFAYIGNQVVFIDTIKHFHQSLATLADTMIDKEKLAMKKECKKFILRDENLSKQFNTCTEEDQEWVLNYLSSGKGTIPYEMITGYDFASSVSGCVHRDKSKCLIALPTDAEYVRVFEKTLICGFSCVNTRLAFDTQILLSNKENEKAIFDLEIMVKNK